VNRRLILRGKKKGAPIFCKWLAPLPKQILFVINPDVCGLILMIAQAVPRQVFYILSDSYLLLDQIAAIQADKNLERNAA
jgi:hypothetical protein